MYSLHYTSLGTLYESTKRQMQNVTVVSKCTIITKT